ncbi:MAG: DUF624 domain-containing protein [Clostridiales bacterium]|nr:DUF624 domain-containing protein [Clostridiales bacterium]
MNLFRYDSPLMQFLNTVTDLFILNVLCIICCIPILTIGPALAAKYDVAMRIVRHEEPAVFVPYFKAFKENFKQAFIIGLFLIGAVFLLSVDWNWMYQTGFENVSPVYFAGAVFISVFVLFITMTIFPIIARFEITIKEAFKTSVLFSMLYFFSLIPIVILILFAGFLCVKYMQWLPLVIVLSHVVIEFCLCLILLRGFKKLEAKFSGEDEEDNNENTESETENKPSSKSDADKIEGENQ